MFDSWPEAKDELFRQNPGVQICALISARTPSKNGLWGRIFCERKLLMGGSIPLFFRQSIPKFFVFGEKDHGKSQDLMIFDVQSLRVSYCLSHQSHGPNGHQESALISWSSTAESPVVVLSAKTTKPSARLSTPGSRTSWCPRDVAWNKKKALQYLNIAMENHHSWYRVYTCIYGISHIYKMDHVPYLVLNYRPSIWSCDDEGLSWRSPPFWRYPARWHRRRWNPSRSLQRRDPPAPLRRSVPSAPSTPWSPLITVPRPWRSVKGLRRGRRWGAGDVEVCRLCWQVVNLRIRCCFRFDDDDWKC